MIVLRQKRGEVIAKDDEAIDLVTAHLEDGMVVAVKGGQAFSLFVDASDPERVASLRRRIRQPEAPLAVMFRDLSHAEEYVTLTPEEQTWVQSTDAPVVALGQIKSAAPWPQVLDPSGLSLWVVLAHAPAHHRIMGRLDMPLAVVGAHFAGERVTTTATEVFEQLGNAVDFILEDETVIDDPADDAVIEPVCGGFVVHHPGRGFAARSVATLEQLAPKLEGRLGVIWHSELDEPSQAAFVIHEAGRTSIDRLMPYRWLPGKRTQEEPWRAGVAMLCALDRRPTNDQWRAFPESVNPEMLAILEGDIGHSGISTSGAGHLFDGMASLLGCAHFVTYPRQAVRELQALAGRGPKESVPEFVRRDWREVAQWALESPERNIAAWRFHAGMAALIVWEAAHHGRDLRLAGDCFQNSLLVSLIVEGARDKGLDTAF